MPMRKNHTSAQMLQTWYIKFPPLILPKNDAMKTMGITMIINAINMIKAYRQ